MKKIMMMTNVRSDLLVFRFSTTLGKKLSSGSECQFGRGKPMCMEGRRQLTLLVKK
jgi:hypothetical protein